MKSTMLLPPTDAGRRTTRSPPGQRRRSSLGSNPLPEPLPEERLPPVGQLPVRALDLTEELHQVLVAGPLGVLEVGGAGLGALQGMVEDADDIVVLISGPGRAFARGHRPLLSAAWWHHRFRDGALSR